MQFIKNKVGEYFLFLIFCFSQLKFDAFLSAGDFLFIWTESGREESDERETDHLGAFDKAEQRHAHEKVQVAAENADQVFCGHLGLLFDVRVGECAVYDRELHNARGQVVREVALIGELGDERRIGSNLAHIVHRRRKLVRGGELFEHSLIALERAQSQAVSVYIVVLREVQVEFVHTTELILVGAIVVARYLVLDEQVEAVACARRVLLLAEQEARLLRVVEAGGQRGVEQRAIAQLCAVDQRAVVEHVAVAVWRRVLFVELAVDGHEDAVAGRHHGGRHLVVLGIGASVEHERKQAMLVRDIERVGHAHIQCERQLTSRSGRGHNLRGVGIEAVAWK